MTRELFTAFEPALERSLAIRALGRDVGVVWPGRGQDHGWTVEHREQQGKKRPTLAEAFCSRSCSRRLLVIRRWGVGWLEIEHVYHFRKGNIPSDPPELVPYARLAAWAIAPDCDRHGRRFIGGLAIAQALSASAKHRGHPVIHSEAVGAIEL